MTASAPSFHEARRDTLLRDFDRRSALARRRLAERYGDEVADRVLASTRAGFEELIPKLPDIGGKANQFAWVIPIAGWMVALHAAMRAEQKTTEEVARLCCEVTDDWMQSTPRLLRFLARKLAFSWAIKRRMRRQARRSQLRRYPEDFVYELREEADGSWALVFTECAVNKLFAELDTRELAPYCNLFDVTYSNYLDMGLDASKTIGLGCETCTLHYRKGKETLIPAPLEGMIPFVERAK